MNIELQEKYAPIINLLQWGQLKVTSFKDEEGYKIVGFEGNDSEISHLSYGFWNLMARIKKDIPLGKDVTAIAIPLFKKRLAEQDAINEEYRKIPPNEELQDDYLGA